MEKLQLYSKTVSSNTSISIKSFQSVSVVSLVTYANNMSKSFFYVKTQTSKAKYCSVEARSMCTCQVFESPDVFRTSHFEIIEKIFPPFQSFLYDVRQ